jgi:hypothetical protein
MLWFPKVNAFGGRRVQTRAAARGTHTREFSANWPLPTSNSPTWQRARSGAGLRHATSPNAGSGPGFIPAGPQGIGAVADGSSGSVGGKRASISAAAFEPARTSPSAARVSSRPPRKAPTQILLTHIMRARVGAAGGAWRCEPQRPFRDPVDATASPPRANYSGPVPEEIARACFPTSGVRATTQSVGQNANSTSRSGGASAARAGALQ